MNSLHVLYLEDNKRDAEDVLFFLEKYNHQVTHVINVQEAKKVFQNQNFDLIILDILIDGKPEGIQFAQELNQSEKNIPFLFLTSVQSKALFDSAKYTRPYTYLLKPFNELEFLYTIELAIEKQYQQTNSLSLGASNAVLSTNFLFIKKNRKIVKVDISKIIYVHVNEKYCDLICDDNNYSIKLSLLKIKELLPETLFRQTHRNYVIHIEKIKEIYLEDNLIVMNNTKQVPFSERYKAAFIKEHVFFK